MTETPRPDAVREDALQPRAGVLFHSNAVAERERLVATFEETLDDSAARRMKMERADVVSASHVMRAYHDIVPPGYYERVRAAIAAAIFGAALSHGFNSFFDESLTHLAASALAAVVSAIWMMIELRSR